MPTISMFYGIIISLYFYDDDRWPRSLGQVGGGNKVESLHVC